MIEEIMLDSVNLWLLLGGALSALAALLHIAIVIGGPAWYRVFGAGDAFAQAAQRGEKHPAVVTLGIAAVLGLWSLYALAGAGMGRTWPSLGYLPFVKFALVAITSIYLLRGVLGFALLAKPSYLSKGFILISSAICSVFGGVHLLGLIQVWAKW